VLRSIPDLFSGATYAWATALAHAFFPNSQNYSSIQSTFMGVPKCVLRVKKKGFSVKRKRRVAQLEHRVERAFLAISIAVLVLVLLGILIVVRRSV
jgi:hypothetical protein